jgi:penicillin-binding protein A
VNKPLRRLALATLAMFLLLLGNVTYLQVVAAADYRERNGNSRIVLEEYGNQRGSIVVAGRPIARSKPTNDQLKYLRIYADGPLYADATGFYSVVYGRSQIEQAQNQVLAGTSGQLFVTRIRDLLSGRTLRGGSVELTLNPAAQQAAAAGLRGKRGAVVALDPRTGAILAMVGSPSYDPNLLASHAASKVQSAYEKLLADPAQPLLNRPLQNTYPPGSLFKVVTAAAALESGKYTPQSKLPSPRRLKLPQTATTLPNFSGQACGDGKTATLTEALRVSCNTAFGSLGLALGADVLRGQAEKFGMNAGLTVPTAVARSVFPDQVDRPQTAFSAIGQFDVRVTPLQAAMFAAAVANNGSLMTPYLVRTVRSPDLTIIDEQNPRELSRAVSSSTATALQDMMVNVVDKGTGTNGQISGVRVGGKTGTAEHGEPDAAGRRPPPYAWYMSFAQVNGQPQVAVAVVVEDPGPGGAEVTGNKLAAPIARQVMEAVLQK